MAALGAPTPLDREELPTSLNTPQPGTRTALVVDDEQGMREVLAALLKSLGYVTMTAQDGREAVERVRENLPALDVVLLDLVMPELDGVEAMRAIRHLGDVPVIIVSGCGLAEVQHRLQDDAPDGLLAKPFNRAQLTDILHRAVDSRKGEER